MNIKQSFKALAVMLHLCKSVGLFLGTQTMILSASLPDRTREKKEKATVLNETAEILEDINAMAPDRGLLSECLWRQKSKKRRTTRIQYERLSIYHMLSKWLNGVFRNPTNKEIRLD
ncbi:hypothetical protein GOODEAATRI_014817 [Goodea atripinnis]|uniref:Uncharacterized protein n=1 Tax=Goodea atripinnis TaxID=208336 RepID=A0ABV0NBM9_9TELE